MANVPNLTVVRDPAKPRKLGRYELEECLGAEGGRETYRARVRGLAGFDRIFAVKCLRRRAGPVTSRTDPFLVAAKRVGSVIDARVARVLDSDILDGAAVVVTEFIPGLDLDRFREWAQSSGELATGTEPAAEKWQRLVAYVGSEIARALASMHAQVPPFVHGSLSPRNVILTSRGSIKVVDAGLAVAAQKGGDGGSQRAAAYAGSAPSGAEPMPAADVRALGAMLYELAVGELPPPDATGAASRQVLEAAWPPMAALLASMLADEPTSRPRARQVADTLAKHWSSVPEATMTAELAALVANFSAFVADSPPANGAGPSPSPELAAPEAPLPSTSGLLSMAPPSPSAIASGSFLAVSDAATRVSPDSGYASAIFRALPAEGAAPAIPQPAKPAAAAPAPGGTTGARVPTLSPATSSQPGTLGKPALPTLPPAPRIEAPRAPKLAPPPAPAPKLAPAAPPAPRLAPAAPPAPKLAPAAPPAASPSSARTVVWSPARAQALGIAPALLSRTLMAPPPPAPIPSPPVAPMTAAPAAALATAGEEEVDPEPMAEAVEWGAQALAALGSQAGVPVALVSTGPEQGSFGAPDGGAPPPVSDPTIEEAFAFAPQQSTPDGWAAPPPPSPAGASGFEAQPFAAAARRELLEDELVEDETAPMVVWPSGEPQGQVDDGEQDIVPSDEPALEPAPVQSAPLEATAFMSDEQMAAPPAAEPDRVAQALPAPGGPVRRASTRNALRTKADLAADGMDEELWQPARSRTKRIVVALLVAAAVGGGAAALVLGPLAGKKSAPPVPLSKARGEKTPSAVTKAPPPETAPAPAAAVAKTAPPGKVPAPAAEKRGALVAKATPAPTEGKATPTAAPKAEAPASEKKAPAAAPSKGAVVANADMAIPPRLVVAAPQPASATGGTVRVRIESKPAGARAWINGQDRGETPVTVQLKTGSARVVLVRAGYLTSQSTLEVREGASVEETLKPVAPPMTGEARFRAECQTTGKLPIVVDGKETGILCPFTKMRVDPGVHTIGLLIPATGQVHQKEVTLRPGVRSIVFGD